MSLKSLFMSCVQVLKASRYNSAENKLLKAVKCFEPLKIFLDMLLASFAALVPNVGCRAHFCRPEKYLQIDQKIFTSLKNVYLTRPQNLEVSSQPLVSRPSLAGDSTMRGSEEKIFESSAKIFS